MGFSSSFVWFCLLYLLVSTDNKVVSTTELLSPTSSSSFVDQETSKTTKGCSNCVVVPEETLQKLLEMTNSTFNEPQPQEPEDASGLDVGDDVHHLPSMKGLSRGAESCNQRLLLAFWESEAKLLQLQKEKDKQEDDARKCKEKLERKIEEMEELERKMEEMEQVSKESHSNRRHHRHHPHRNHHLHHYESSPTLRDHYSLSTASDSSCIMMSDIQDVKEVLLDAILDVKENGIGCSKKNPDDQKLGWPPKDCYNLYELGERRSGIYTIYPLSGSSESRGLSVWCDMEEGGWTVVLQRKQLPHPVSFNKTWEDYKKGFGDPQSEYWIGNEVLHQLTTLGKQQALRVDMKDFDGVHKFASYGRFSVGSEEDNYRLTVDNFSSRSTVKGDSLKYHNGMKFSAFDRDNDANPGNCAITYGGFWMKSCHHTNPTGPIGSKGTNPLEMSYYNFITSRVHTTLKALSMKIKQSQ